MDLTLLNFIKESINDKSTKLVFIDWLKEQDNPLAKYIETPKEITYLNVTIIGDGASLWGESDGEFLITKFIFYEDSMNLYGKDTKWYQYTDRSIEKEVNLLFGPLIKLLYNLDVNILWSEQGIQPKDGWDFDVSKL